MDVEISQVKYCIYIHVFKPQLGRAAIRLKRQAPGCPAGAFWLGLHLGMQMNFDVSWRFALAIPAFYETARPSARRQGWPAVLVPWQLAILQMPFRSGDEHGEEAADVLFEAIWDAAEGGSLEVSERVVEVREVVDPEATARARDAARAKSQAWLAAEIARGGIIAGAYAGLDEIDAGAGVPPVFVEEKNTRHYIGPAAFAAWLAAQDMEPSKHIAAWFKACGKAQIASAGVAASLSAEDVQDLPTLVRYRLQFVGKADQQHAPWTGLHVAILAEGLRSECAAGGARGAKKRLGEKLGLSGERVRQLMVAHDYNTGTGEKIKAAAKPFDAIRRHAHGGAA